MGDLEPDVVSCLFFKYGPPTGGWRQPCRDSAPAAPGNFSRVPVPAQQASQVRLQGQGPQVSPDQHRVGRPEQPVVAEERVVEARAEDRARWFGREQQLKLEQRPGVRNQKIQVSGHLTIFFSTFSTGISI